MKHAKFSSVLLAALIQFMPIARQIFMAPLTGSSPMAVIFRWSTGLLAVMGSVDAVSGASTVITSSLTATGTNGVPFTYRITTGPQVASSYTATPLPPGLALNATSGRITGTPTQTGVMAVTLTGCDGRNGCTPAAILTVTILPGGSSGSPPTITTQPASQTVTAGSGVTFSVVATGTGTLSYQWKFNNANISGANGTSYSIASAQAGQAGSYSVLVSNSFGSVTSSSATLTVNPLPVAPSITSPPASQTVTAGGSATFNVTATGTGPLLYQWQFNNANISGATGASYAIANVQAGHAGSYSVIVSNAAGTATSTSALLTVNPAPIAPSITTQLAPQSVIAGGSVTFNVAASGTGPLMYQWKLNNANIGGATSSTYSMNNVQAVNAGGYSVLVSNTAGSVLSSSATLTVNAAPVGPSITGQPASLTVAAGSSASFTVTATGTGPLFYQWRFNTVPIGGATTATYTLNNSQPGNGGSYDVIVSNAIGSVTSASATLVVNPAPTPPSIVTQPASQSAATGASVTLTVAATGTGPLVYSWRWNNTPIVGATSPSLTLNNLQAANAGNYSVVVSNAAGVVTSDPAILTVQPPPPVAPTITQNPASQSVNAGASATLQVTASGTKPMNYQWRFNSTAILNATNTTLTLANIQTNQSGGYDVVVSNLVGAAVSTTATLSVVPASSNNNDDDDPDHDGDSHSATLIVTISGKGTVAPAPRLQGLKIGQTYTLQAIPAIGYIFHHWSGDLTGTSPILDFKMRAHLRIQANFVRDPAFARGAVFTGLFAPATGGTLENSGQFALRMNNRGKFTGWLETTAAAGKIRGQFDSHGDANCTIQIRNGSPLSADLHVDFAAGATNVTGHIADGNWTADLLGSRSLPPATTTPVAGSYQLVLSDLASGSNSLASAMVSASGNVQLQGQLPDATPVNANFNVAIDDNCAVFIALDNNQSALIGWLTFTPSPSPGVTGILLWLKGSIPIELTVTVSP